MKDKSLELKTIVNEVKIELGNKVKSLSKLGVINSENQSLINNINKQVTDLENNAEEVNSLSASNPDVILNFRKRASEIWVEIAELS